MTRRPTSSRGRSSCATPLEGDVTPTRSPGCRGRGYRTDIFELLRSEGGGVGIAIAGDQSLPRLDGLRVQHRVDDSAGEGAGSGGVDGLELREGGRVGDVQTEAVAGAGGQSEDAVAVDERVDRVD